MATTTKTVSYLNYGQEESNDNNKCNSHIKTILVAVPIDIRASSTNYSGSTNITIIAVVKMIFAVDFVAF